MAVSRPGTQRRGPTSAANTTFLVAWDALLGGCETDQGTGHRVLVAGAVQAHACSGARAATAAAATDDMSHGAGGPLTADISLHIYNAASDMEAAAV